MHNNWIKGHAAKRARFREWGLWRVNATAGSAVERAPASCRGAYAATLALFGTLGSAFAVFAHGVIALGVDLVVAVGSEDDASTSAVGAQWRGVCAVVALAPFGAAVSCSTRLPESMRWLAQKRRFRSTFGPSSRCLWAVIQ